LDRPPSLPIDKDLTEFLTGVENSQTSTVIVILASTELVESEGQRSTNLALEFSQRGIPSVFGYWRWEPEYWVVQNRLDEGILQIPVDVIASWPEIIFRSLRADQKILLVEFPHPSFFKLIAEAHACGWTVIYDVVDDWEEFFRVGQANWYDAEFERHLLHNADAVITVNQFLSKHLDHEGAAIIPNGLSVGVEKVDKPRELERGELTVGYFGYLAGAWFDWQLLAEVAEKNPKWIFYLIGYGGSPEGVQLPNNIRLLGKKPRSELASYATDWDVAIIPFKDERLAMGADPIKTYEYLAMGLPVVVTGVLPPAGGEAFVRRAQGLDEFIQALKSASQQRQLHVQDRVDFSNTCTWSKRVDVMMKLIESGDQRIAMKQSLFEVVR
jgi:glycosyltransferase involved in cell wall biosynthesis